MKQEDWKFQAIRITALLEMYEADLEASCLDGREVQQAIEAVAPFHEWIKSKTDQN